MIELLTVIGIIGILVAITVPTVTRFKEGDATISATRQMLDDVARARQLAINQRTTVYMVFVPENFWTDPRWSVLLPAVQTSLTVTQLYGAQYTGYLLMSLRSLGDQPGQVSPRYLTPVKILPESAFVSEYKFTAPQFPNPAFIVETNATMTPGQGYPIYGFLTTNGLPFPIAAVWTNRVIDPTYTFITVPFIAFNYLGQLVGHDGNVLPYDEYIPLSRGSARPPLDPATRNPIQGAADLMEIPEGNGSNQWHLIHIDALTGRARLERQELQ